MIMKLISNKFSTTLSIATIGSGIIPTNIYASIAPECRPMSQIYPTGKELCENMWSDSFEYYNSTDADTKAYTMWFFDAKNNPNQQVVQNVWGTSAVAPISFGNGGTGEIKIPIEKCWLDYYHKDDVGPEPETFTECHPWKESSCCRKETVGSAEKLKMAYGAGYHWDRCGKLSPECERFFVQEACFYECEPSAGLYRKFHPWGSDSSGSNKLPIDHPGSYHYDSRCDPDAPDYNPSLATDTSICGTHGPHNTWQMWKMPIKASYCDAWWTACHTDLFCASNSGDFFTCASEYEEFDVATAMKNAKKEAEEKRNREVNDVEKEKNTVIIILAVVFLIGTIGGLILQRQYMEKKYGILKETNDDNINVKGEISNRNGNGIQMAGVKESEVIGSRL